MAKKPLVHDWLDFYSELIKDRHVDTTELSQRELSQREDQYDKEAHKLYEQAYDHRERLITFYIRYITWFSVMIGILVIAQASANVFSHGTLALIPEWTLNILVTGMFANFIGLLKIVTKSVWNYDSFFNHLKSVKRTPEQDKEQ